MLLSLLALALTMVEIDAATPAATDNAPRFRSNARRGNAVSFHAHSSSLLAHSLPRRARWARPTTSTPTSPSCKASNGSPPEPSTAFPFGRASSRAPRLSANWASPPSGYRLLPRRPPRKVSLDVSARATSFSLRSISGNGYDVYDLYDLGEFDQKGGKSTKWGTKEEYISAIAAAKKVGIVIYVGKMSSLLVPASY